MLEKLKYDPIKTPIYLVIINAIMATMVGFLDHTETSGLLILAFVLAGFFALVALIVVIIFKESAIEMIVYLFWFVLQVMAIIMLFGMHGKVTFSISAIAGGIAVIVSQYEKRKWLASAGFFVTGFGLWLLFQ